MARVKIQPGGKVLIAMIVLGALLFLFFEFKPTAKESQSSTSMREPSTVTSARMPQENNEVIAGPKEVAKTTPKMAAPAEGSVQEAKLNSPIRIYFAFNKFHINKNVYCIFDRIQYLVRERGAGGIHILVEGNADSIGAPWYNLRLSKQRAKRVADSLSVRLDVPLGEISLVANGSSKPIASNSTAAGRADNRRTDVIIYR